MGGGLFISSRTVCDWWILVRGTDPFSAEGVDHVTRFVLLTLGQQRRDFPED